MFQGKCGCALVGEFEGGYQHVKIEDEKAESWDGLDEAIPDAEAGDDRKEHHQHQACRRDDKDWPEIVTNDEAYATKDLEDACEGSERAEAVADELGCRATRGEAAYAVADESDGGNAFTYVWEQKHVQPLSYTYASS